MEKECKRVAIRKEYKLLIFFNYSPDKFFHFLIVGTFPVNSQAAPALEKFVMTAVCIRGNKVFNLFFFHPDNFIVTVHATGKGCYKAWQIESSYNLV